MAIIAGKEVPTINIRGKEYPTVATRVQLAHAAKGIGTGFSMIGNEVFSVKDRHFVRITLKIGDNLFSGSAEIHFNLSDKSADATNPLETAETSALGRALAFAGYMVDTIASADEMLQSERMRVVEERPQPQPQRVAAQGTVKALPEPQERLPAHAPEGTEMATDAQKRAIGALCDRLGRERPATGTLTFVQATSLIASLNKAIADQKHAARLPQGA